MAATPHDATDVRRTKSRAEPPPRADHAGPTRNSLAFEGTIDRTPTGWVVQIPVRAEDVWVEKQTFVVEEVCLSRDEQVLTRKVEGQTRREELRVDNVPKPGRPRAPRSK